LNPHRGGFAVRTFANEILQPSSGRLGDKSHLDEAVVSIRGKRHWPWHAVDQDGFVLDVLVQSRRNARAAKRLMRKLSKGQGRSPRVMITDKLRSYDAAKTEIMPGVEHRSHKGLDNRQRILTSRSGEESGPCRASSHEATCNASTLPTIR
jgi:putative transposase